MCSIVPNINSYHLFFWRAFHSIINLTKPLMPTIRLFLHFCYECISHTCSRTITLLSLFDQLKCFSCLFSPPSPVNGMQVVFRFYCVCFVFDFTNNIVIHIFVCLSFNCACISVGCIDRWTKEFV